MPLDAAERDAIVAKIEEAEGYLQFARLALMGTSTYDPTQVIIKLYHAYVRSKEAMNMFAQDWKD